MGSPVYPERDAMSAITWDPGTIFLLIMSGLIRASILFIVAAGLI